MKNKKLAENIKFYLQMFAEGGEGGDGGEGGEGGSGNETLSFDDFLAQEGNQAEYDRRLEEARNAAVKKAEEKWKLLTDSKLTEAEKLAKMNKEEKAEYKYNQLQEKVKQMERKEALATMSNTARNMLKEKNINIPDELLAYIVREDADETKKNVDAFAKLFDDAVGAELKKNARQETPRDGAGGMRETSGKLNIGKMAREARIIK